MSSDPLTAPEAGDRAIRGGIMRVAGHGAGLALTAAASVLLLRYLGVADFGRYIVVVSLVAIVGGLSDAGLTLIGQREYVRVERASERRALLGSLLGLRLVLTPVAVGLVTAFAVLAGYEGAQVAGTAIAGAGLIFANAAFALTLPLTTALRLGAVTLVEVSRQLVLTAGIAGLVAAGAGLVSFFWVYVPAGIAGLMAALGLVGGERSGPRWDPARWSALARAAAPVALALVINVVYLRVLVILVSLLEDSRATGLFGTSYRVIEIFIGVPQLMVGSAFPILAHAATRDEARLAYVLQRLAEASLLVAAGLVLVLGLAADPIVRALGGAEYADAAPVLALQSAALLGAFLTQVWIFGLVAIDRQAAVAKVNALGLAVVVALGLTLIPAAGIRGAALAAVLGEAVLAIAAVVLLVRARPALRPGPERVLRIVVAAGVAAGCALLPVPDLARAAAALAVYGTLVWALRAHPLELIQALDPRRRVQP